VDCINSTQDKGQWWAVVDMVVNVCAFFKRKGVS
jgi:hypothetical protein